MAPKTASTKTVETLHHTEKRNAWGSAYLMSA